MLKPGAKAPPFSLPSDGGKPISLKALQGRKVVLYFYPKDDTSGCTVEACEFRDHWAEVKRRRAVVLGISPDPVSAHDKFKRKYALPFPLLSDADHAVAEAYGAWGDKSMYGRKYQGILRTTFVLDEAGRVLRVFEKVKPRGHAAEVLAVLETA